MKPADPFVAVFYCQRCRCETEHYVEFMTITKETWCITFLAICSYCVEDGDEYFSIGFVASMSVADWLLIAPEETLENLN